MAKSTSRYLDLLPTEIHQKIINVLLAGTNKPIFPPKYNGFWESKNHFTEFYGEETAEKRLNATALLNWSMTCRRLRALAAPFLFATVTLRNEARSIASVRALMDTAYWSHVRGLVYVGVWSTFEEGSEEFYGDERYALSNDRTSRDGDMSQDHDESFETRHFETEQQRELAMMEMVREASSILSNLPPNLTSLILDFTQPWDIDCIYEDVVDVENTFRGRISKVLEAVIKNDLSERMNFELVLRNVPPYQLSIKDAAGYKRFTNNVTSFTLILPPYHTGEANTEGRSFQYWEFAARLNTYFFDHLQRARTFKLAGSHVWPLGSPHSQRSINIPLALPLDFASLSRVEHVSFKEVYVCYELIAFLLLRIRTLKTIELVDCHSKVYDDIPWLSAGQSPRWTDLFAALADAQPESLVEFSVSNPSKSLDDLTQSYANEMDPTSLNRLTDTLHEEEGRMAREIAGGANPADLRRRQRRVFVYSITDSKGSYVLDCPNYNTAAFLEGSDHAQYLRLIEIVEKNIARQVKDRDDDS